jgi:hypothetical protein
MRPSSLGVGRVAYDPEHKLEHAWIPLSLPLITNPLCEMNPSGVITNWSHLYIAHRPLDGRCLPFVSFYVRGAENQQPHAAIFLRTKQAAKKKEQLRAREKLAVVIFLHSVGRCKNFSAHA